GLVDAMTVDELDRLDAGYRHRGDEGFPHRGAGVRVPALEELLTSFPALQLVLEVKDGSVVPGLLQLFETHDLYDRAVVGSFRERWLDEIRRASSGRVRPSAGTRATRDRICAARAGACPRTTAAALHATVLLPGHPVVDRALTQTA